ncbi:MAG: hypothetical protein QOD84_3112 [Acidobacteriaceae bacterium]|jgi:hypothetical protein
MMVVRSVRSSLLALLILIFSTASFAQIAISVSFAPPALPVYEQPLCPAEGYIWTPGYWAYDSDYEDYYWVPGTWVEAPEVGYLWTPGYWAWRDNGYAFNEGYWGPRVGFYGGISYGYGYFGEGYEGGRWENGRFFYNRSVNNINLTNIRNVYNTTVVNNYNSGNRVSYNGGNGGINARPRPEDQMAARERHLSPLPAQREHVQAARGNQQLRASVNQGRPPVAATPRPGAFNDRGVVQAREAGAPYRPPAGRGPGQSRANNPGSRPENNVPRPPTAVHPSDLPSHQRSAPDTGNQNVDRKYQQQQEKLYTKQNQEHQKLQQRQDQEHQRLSQQRADDSRRQQVESRHQQQTQQLEQKHVQQQQRLDQRQPPPRNESKSPREKP